MEHASDNHDVFAATKAQMALLLHHPVPYAGYILCPSSSYCLSVIKHVCSSCSCQLQQQAAIISKRSVESLSCCDAAVRMHLQLLVMTQLCTMSAVLVPAAAHDHVSQSTRRSSKENYFARCLQLQVAILPSICLLIFQELARSCHKVSR